MHPLVLTLAAASMVCVGSGICIDRVQQWQRRTRARQQSDEEKRALESEIESQEILRHESELKSGEFDLLG